MIREFVKSYPLLSIAVLSFLITLAFTIIYRQFTDQKRMKEIREQQKALQAKSKQFRDQPDKMLELQQEMMKLSTDQMKASMKITLITMLPFILFFGYLKGLYAGIGDLVVWGVNIPGFGTGVGWFVAYIVFSMISSILLRKVMKVY